jgi:hypothetical protein
MICVLCYSRIRSRHRQDGSKDGPMKVSNFSILSCTPSTICHLAQGAATVMVTRWSYTVRAGVYRHWEEWGGLVRMHGAQCARRPFPDVADRRWLNHIVSPLNFFNLIFVLLSPSLCFIVCNRIFLSRHVFPVFWRKPIWGLPPRKFNIEQNLPVFNNLLNYFLPTEKKI